MSGDRDTPPPSRRRRILGAARWVALALVVLCGVASVVRAPYDVVRPGSPIDARALIAKPRYIAHGSALKIPTVDEHRATWIEVAWYTVAGGATLRARSRATRERDSSLEDQGRVDPTVLFLESSQVALLVAAREAQLPAQITGDGVRIRTLGRTNPNGFRSGDVIRAVGGHRVRSVEELRALLGRVGGAARRQPTALELAGGRVIEAALAGERDPALALRVNAVVTAQPRVEVEGFAWKRLPAGVEGNSSGLGMALAAYEVLRGEPVTDQNEIWATGELDEDGSVYSVGGVAEKARAAAAAGVDVLVVPVADVAAAKRAAGGHTTVVGADSFTSAVKQLGRG